MAKIHKYDERIVDEICELLSEGILPGEVLTRLKISRYSVWKWRQIYPEFKKTYDEALKCGAEKLSDEIIMIADDLNDVKTEELSNPLVAKARLQTDVRRWQIGKLLPEEYGDSVAVTGKGGKDLIPEPNVQTRIPRLMAVLAIAMPDKTNTELHELATKMIAKVTPPTNGYNQ